MIARITSRCRSVLTIIQTYWGIVMFFTTLLRVALATAIAALPMSNAFAHCFVGSRFFPATLATDDPCVADEMSLPTPRIP